MKPTSPSGYARILCLMALIGVSYLGPVQAAPPPAAFGIVWSILYVMMGFALAMIVTMLWRSSGLWPAPDKAQAPGSTGHSM